jgi:hypothetical protein
MANFLSVCSNWRELFPISGGGKSIEIKEGMAVQYCVRDADNPTKSKQCLLIEFISAQQIDVIDSAMKLYGLQGDTHRKGTSFFLQAARYAGLPLSSLILAQTRKQSSGPRKRRMPLGTEKQNGTNSKGELREPLHIMGPTKTITVKNGISLSLTASADMFAMDGDDRQFVLKLLDEMEAYEKGLLIREAEK